MTTRDIDVDGIRLHVAEAGAGPALILLHGLTATHANWEHTIPAFADRWRVVAPDLPGHGRSAKPDAPYTVDFYAGVIRSLGRTLGIEEAVVVGNSLGGQIAVEMGIAYPTWTRALVLVAPAGGFSGTVQGLRWAVGAVTGPRTLRMALPWALDRCFYDPQGASYERRRRLLTERLASDDYPAFARAVSRSVVGALAGAGQPLRRLTQPTLVVWGRHDRVIRLSASRWLLRDLPQAQLAVLERSGHIPMVEEPEDFNRYMSDFLGTVDAAPRLRARHASGDA